MARRALVGAFGTAQDGSYARNEFAHTERFHDVVIALEFQSQYPIGLRPSSGEQHNRHVTGSAQLTAYGEPVEAGNMTSSRTNQCRMLGETQAQRSGPSVATRVRNPASCSPIGERELDKGDQAFVWLPGANGRVWSVDLSGEPGTTRLRSSWGCVELPTSWHASPRSLRPSRRDGVNENGRALDGTPVTHR